MVNIQTSQGDSFSRIINFTNSAGAAIDITGYTFYLTVKKDVADLDAAAKISATVTPEQLVSPASGSVTISVSKTTMATVAPGTYLYDIKYKKGDGTVFTALSGNFTVTPTITLRASV